MGSPLVSVIIPAYNHEKFIAAAVESVLQQSCGDLELIVIDDGSQDHTGDIVQGYTDSRLAYLYQDNQDAFNTINRGLGLAKGRYIAILNSDDVYTVDRLERIFKFREDNDADCVITDVVPISDDSKEFIDPTFGWNIWHQNNRTFYRQCNDLYTAFLKGNLMVTTSNLFMTAKAAKRVGSFCSLRYLHDYDYIFRMMLAHPDGVHYMDQEKLLYYRIHSGNTLGEAAIKGRIQDQDVIRKYLLARVPEELRMLVDAGSSRLAELERELHEVRAVLEPENINRGVRPAVRELFSSLNIWLNKKLA
jgi:glycosyltransferase involved in cell wall biosynthesis